jgi:hypothetical protein
VVVRLPVEARAFLVGMTLVVVGILGFAHVFHASARLGVVHVGSGVVGIALARAPGGAGVFLPGAGVAYLGLWLLGVVGAGGWIPLGVGANWFHFVLGVVAVALSAAPRRL